MTEKYETQKRTSPLLLAQRWAQDPDKPQPCKVQRLAFSPFCNPIQSPTKPHPWSVEASWEGN